MTPEFIAPLVNFAIVCLVLRHFGKKPIGEMFRTRAQNLKDNLESAQKEATESHETYSKWLRKWDHREQEIATNKREAESRIANLKTRTLENAEKQALRIKDEAKITAESESTKTKDLLVGETIRRSVGMARNHLTATLAEKERQQVVTECLELLNNGAGR